MSACATRGQREAPAVVLHAVIEQARPTPYEVVVAGEGDGVRVEVADRGLPGTSSSPEQCKYIAGHCDAHIAVVENQSQLDKLLKVRAAPLAPTTCPIRSPRRTTSPVR